jgi:hypothetical protein
MEWVADAVSIPAAKGTTKVIAAARIIILNDLMVLPPCPLLR